VLFFFFLFCGSYYDLLDSGDNVMVFNATFNNITVISWWSVLLV
jgi:hypothetical protein